MEEAWVGTRRRGSVRRSSRGPEQGPLPVEGGHDHFGDGRDDFVDRLSRVELRQAQRFRSGEDDPAEEGRGVPEERRGTRIGVRKVVEHECVQP